MVYARCQRVVNPWITASLLASGVWMQAQVLPPKTVQGHGFTLQAAKEFGKARVELAPRLTAKQVGTDIPYDEAPPRTKFRFSEGESESILEVIPLRDAKVKNFAKAYPSLSTSAKALKAVLERGSLAPKICKDLPVWNVPDAMQTIHARAQILETPWCRGIQFLTSFTQEEGAPVDAESLTCVFQGLSRDGAFYIAAELHLTQKDLPKEGCGFAEQPQAKIQAMYAQVEKQLNAAPDESFQPSMSSIQALVQSLKPIE